MAITITGGVQLSGGVNLGPGGGGTPTPSFVFQGSNFGYSSGGNADSGPYTNVIQKFSFTSDANATDVGDLTDSLAYASGQSSSSNGYSSGGINPANSPTRTSTIDKFPFSSDDNATDVGDLTQPRNASAGHSSGISGYTSGGYDTSPVSTIDKFPVASDGNANDIGDLTRTVIWKTGQSSSVSGYASGGDIGPNSFINEIEKFSFSSDGNGTDVGDLTVSRDRSAGQSSTDSGYTSGGYTGSNPFATTSIDKFPFASDGNATFVGNLSTGIHSNFNMTGQSSTTSGYASGGSTGANPSINTIDKFPFSSDNNASDIADLTQALRGNEAQQY
jgi:hypothetical protein